MKTKRINTVSVRSSLCLIAIWWIASVIVGAKIILPDPLSAFKAFCKLLISKEFLFNVLFTISRALISFVIITLSGLLAGIFVSKNKIAEQAINPLITVLKATPVMSVILIALLWFKTGTVPVFSAFLMAFPVMLVQVVNGCKSIDPKLEQMCVVYGIEGKSKMKNLIFPSLKPFVITGAKQTLSMIWKVVIAAEVLTVPEFGVGRSLHVAQINLETSEVFAWTLVAILLTALGDFVFDCVSSKGGKK